VDPNGRAPRSTHGLAMPVNLPPLRDHRSNQPRAGSRPRRAGSLPWFDESLFRFSKGARNHRRTAWTITPERESVAVTSLDARSRTQVAPRVKSLTVPGEETATAGASVAYVESLAPTLSAAYTASLVASLAPPDAESLPDMLSAEHVASLAASLSPDDAGDTANFSPDVSSDVSAGSIAKPSPKQSGI